MREQAGKEAKPLLKALQGKVSTRPPFWLMRQAGRYLPEYLKTRSLAGSFLDLVYNPELACEVTMQPIRRFGMDAAILFSDILVVPQALGRKLTFEEGEGPKLDPLIQGSSLPMLMPAHFDSVTAPVIETVANISARLKTEGYDDTALIGFAGSPWTLACYMVEGGGSRDFIATRAWAYSDPDTFGQLIDLLIQATIRYLSAQIEAGAEAVQLFDSWAGVLDEMQFRHWVISPTRRITDTLRRNYPHIPVIGFAKGSGISLQSYARDSGITAVSLDHTVPLRWASAALQPSLTVQGNLDPVCLMAGGDALDMGIEHIYSHLSLGPFIFNLGHGIHKDTPVQNVARLAKQVHAWRG
jgi:uroporphyrinogen decarboxylase